MPTISTDGKTYTFQIRNDYAFSPPATGVVTAHSIKYMFERMMHASLQSPGYQFLADPNGVNIEGAIDYREGRANEITGIQASGSILTIRLTQPRGRFLALLAMPFTCAIPEGILPLREKIITVDESHPLPTAGPYYVSRRTPNVGVTLTRNPNYAGPRPHRFDSIEYTVAMNLEQAYQRVLANEDDFTLDYPPGVDEYLAQNYGPDSPAAGRGWQRWFTHPANCISYLAMNTERPLFRNSNMRKAVNFVIDRTAMVGLSGPYAAQPTQEYLPPSMPGYTDLDVYPDHPDIARARELAGWHPGDPLRHAVFYYGLAAPGPQRMELVRQQLFQIGIYATPVGFRGFAIYDAMGRRYKPGHTMGFDLGTAGWCQDYFDPWSFLRLFDGTTIQPANNNNLAYFNDPLINARLHAAELLVGDERIEAFAGIARDLEEKHAPWAAWSNPSDNWLFSERLGCHIQQPAYETTDLAALCVRPEITVADVNVTEPVSGTVTATFTVRLSSEMDNAVTVDYATADGTAHAPDDYGATSGTLNFAPSQRTKTVDVTVNADGVDEPDETFFLNLSNESTGTLVDGQAIGTIADGTPSARYARANLVLGRR
jgi:ABC-type oligopeptide transport system substrate-binding subunit